MGGTAFRRAEEVNDADGRKRGDARGRREGRGARVDLAKRGCVRAIAEVRGKGKRWQETRAKHNVQTDRVDEEPCWAGMSLAIEIE